MILLDKTGEAPKHPMLAAGHHAEQQMAFYLRRAFADRDDVRVFNDLSLIRNGEHAQIDHLVLHRFGFILIESKSVHGRIRVNAHAEFERVGKYRQGMKSPIVQADMQADLLRNLLNDHKTQLRRKVTFGLRQGYFGEERFHVFVAISDNGIIEREKIDPPELVKADQVVDRIHQVIDRYQRLIGFTGTIRVMREKKAADDYLPPYTDEELQQITDFLLSTNETTRTDADISTAPSPEPVAPPTSPPTRPAAQTYLCTHCHATDLFILHGRYGYYFKCQTCNKNTSIDFTCSACGNKAKITKSDREFARACPYCNHHEIFFTNSASTSPHPT